MVFIAVVIAMLNQGMQCWVASKPREIPMFEESRLAVEVQKYGADVEHFLFSFFFLFCYTQLFSILILGCIAFPCMMQKIDVPVCILPDQDA